LHVNPLPLGGGYKRALVDRLVRLEKKMETMMKHNGDTGELVCYVPAGDEVLRTVEVDIAKVYLISEAIQTAYVMGSRLGRLHLQRDLERRMDELNNE